MYSVHDSLDPGFRADLEHLLVDHDPGQFRNGAYAVGRQPGHHRHATLAAGSAVWPIISHHPVTGRPYINVSESNTRWIIGTRRRRVAADPQLSVRRDQPSGPPGAPAVAARHDRNLGQPGHAALRRRRLFDVSTGDAPVRRRHRSPPRGSPALLQPHAAAISEAWHALGSTVVRSTTSSPI